MAGYRRLISYIYAYEGEEKGKNIGFAKLEARNGQCRLSINVKKIYAGGNDMGVYLLSSGQEIFISCSRADSLQEMSRRALRSSLRRRSAMRR